MQRLAPCLVLASLVGLSACSEPSASRPPETPESPASSSEPSGSSEPGSSAAPEAAPEGSADKPAAGPKVDKSMSLDTYELTPSDCEALGKQYGEAARGDQMSALSPKISEKQRQATAAQVDKVVSGLEDLWIAGCQSSLVNKAVDHDSIKCAMAAKTVKAFDVCLNGEGGTPQPAGKPRKK